ncbi:MAG TPA: hypothetical protein VIG33_13615 [Pseudobdellovibrionaceae bacterium]|jgi:hypothetical protein
MVKDKVLILFLIVTSTVSFAKPSAKVNPGDPCGILASEYKKLKIASSIQFIARCQKVQNGNFKNEASETLTEGSVCIAKFENPNTLSELPGACDPSETPARADFYILSGNGHFLTEKGEKRSRVLPSMMKVDLQSLNKMGYYAYTFLKQDRSAESNYINWCMKTIRDEKFDCEKSLLGSPFSFLKLQSGACNSENHIIVKKEGPDQYEALYDYDRSLNILFIRETVPGDYLLTRSQISAVLNCEEVQ